MILRFDEPVEEVKGGIIIPQTSQQRPEFGEIVDIGRPTNDTEAAIAKDLADLKAQGRRIAVSFAAGTSFHQTNADPKVWGWLKAYRAFRITELPAYLEETT